MSLICGRTRRTLLLLVSFLALVLSLTTGCAAPQAPKAAAPPAMAPEPQRGGVLRYATATKPQTLNYYTGGRVGEYIALTPAYEMLLNFDFKFRNGSLEDYRIDYPVVPWLAESWEQPNDTTYIFHLRQGVKWHDGVEFTADDVVWSYEYVRDPKNAFRGAGNVVAMDTIERVDKYTVRVTTKGPAPDQLQLLADRQMVLLPKHIIDRGDKYEKVTIGTGPFRLKSYDPDAGVSHVRNADYWQRGKPYLEGIEIAYGLDESGQRAAFIAKQTDILQLGDKAQFDALQAVAPEIKHDVFAIMYGWSLKPRMDAPPFSDVRVRRAAHLAIDRQAINKTLHFNMGAINSLAMAGAKKGWAIPEEELLKLPGFRQPKDQDIAEAKRLLAEAGYPAGFKTAIMETTERTGPLRGNTEMACAQLRAVGIECSLELLDRGVFNTREKDGKYELLSMYTTGDRLDSQIQGYFHSKGVYNKGFGINDSRLDSLIEKQRVTMDAKERKKIILDIQRLALDQVYVIPLVDPAIFAAWQPWVHDYVYWSGTQTYLQAPERAWMEVDRVPKR